MYFIQYVFYTYSVPLCCHCGEYCMWLTSFTLHDILSGFLLYCDEAEVERLSNLL